MKGTMKGHVSKFRCRQWLTTTTLAALLTGFLLLLGPRSSLAACSDHEDIGPLNYVPTLVTAPLSLALSGVGYVTDLTIITGQLIAIPVAICSVPVILVAAASQGDGAGSVGEVCLRTVGRSIGLEQLFVPHAGHSIYRGTESWRCPVDF